MTVRRNEVGGGINTTPGNMGGKDQKLESPIRTPFFAKEGFAFASIADAKDKSKWLEAIEAKNLVPFPYVEGIEANNTEANIKNGRFQDYLLKDGVRGSNYRFDISNSAFESLKDYANSEYTRIFRVTTEGEVTCDLQDDGSVKGEPLTSVLVGDRNEATDDDVPFVNVQLKYEEKNFDIIKPETFDAYLLEGIFDVRIEITSASATSIKFLAIENFTNNQITNFVTADIVLLDDTGAVHAASFVAADPTTGEYELTGTGFANDFTVGLNGIVTQGETFYEGIAPAVVSGI